MTAAAAAAAMAATTPTVTWRCSARVCRNLVFAALMTLGLLAVFTFRWSTSSLSTSSPLSHLQVVDVADKGSGSSSSSSSSGVDLESSELTTERRIIIVVETPPPPTIPPTTIPPMTIPPTTIPPTTIPPVATTTAATSTSPPTSTPKPLLMSPNDRSLHCDEWDKSPYVNEENKLVFCTIPKVACTTFKKYLRKFAHIAKWKSTNENEIHNPRINGLKRMCNYQIDKASHFLEDDSFMKVAFVREPAMRLVSAYLDKFVHTDYALRSLHRNISFEGLVGMLEKNIHNPQRNDPHWRPQFVSCDLEKYHHLYRIYTFEDMRNGTVSFLSELGLWDAELEAVFGAPDHPTESRALFEKFYSDKSLLKRVYRIYKKDYELFGYPRPY